MLSGHTDREHAQNHKGKGTISKNVRELQSKETTEITAGGAGRIERYQPDRLKRSGPPFSCFVIKQRAAALPSESDWGFGIRIKK